MLKNSVDKLIITKAIRKVKQTCKGCDIETIGDKADCGGCYTGVIISTLEKRIPMEATEVVRNFHTTEGNTITVTTRECARCGENVGNWKYCPECGQRQYV